MGGGVVDHGNELKYLTRATQTPFFVMANKVRCFMLIVSLILCNMKATYGWIDSSLCLCQGIKCDVHVLYYTLHYAFFKLISLLIVS